jgi:hypothetical protein
MMRPVIRYEDSDLPEIAIAPAEFGVPLALTWVRSHQEPMMLRDGDGHWALIFVAANNSVQIESPAFMHVTDVRVAASKMRTWLDRQGLMVPGDSRS